MVAAGALALALLVAVLVGRAVRLGAVNVNWDEFYFLSRVHELARGDLSERVLTFHARLFAWVPFVADTEVDQVIAVRAVMWLLAPVTTTAAFVLGRRLGGSRSTALVGALAGQSLTFVVLHGSAARFDPPLAALMMAALALLLCEGRARVVVAAGSCALAFAITLKAALFAPTLLAFLLLRPTARRRGDAGTFIGVFVVVAGGLYALHSSTLAPAPQAAATLEQAGGLGAVLTRSLPGELAIVKGALKETLRADRALWLAVAASVVVVALAAAFLRERRRDALLAGALLLPVVSALGYRNSFAYFYVSVFPAAGVVVGVAASIVLQRGPKRGAGPVAAACVLAVAALLFARPPLWQLVRQRDDVTAQRTVLAAVHAIFPRPVPYIDRCSMVVGYPKVGPFMSTWGLERYRAAGRPVLARGLAEARPQFVLANVASLHLDDAADPRDRYALLPEDAAALRANFVPHWGPLWVAGHRLVVAPDGPTSFEHLVPGRFRLEADRSIVIDGVLVAPGSDLSLSVGRHEVRVDDGGGPVDVTLRTVEAGAPPPLAPPRERLFRTLTGH